MAADAHASSEAAGPLARLALGTAQFGMRYGIAHQGERVSRAQALDIVREAAGLGIRTADTAMAYGDSEEVLGHCPLQGWQVVSKLPGLPAEVQDVGRWVQSAVESSLQRLKVERLHALLLHRPQDLLGAHGPALLRALRDLRSTGRVGKIGVSIYAPEELPALLALHPFELVQAPASILDDRLHRSGWARRLGEAGVEIHTRSAYLQGLLLSPAVQRERFGAWAEVWRTWQAWLQAHGLSALQACVSHALAQPHVQRVVIGFDHVAQLQAAAAAADTPLPPAPEWPAFDARLLNPALWRL